MRLLVLTTLLLVLASGRRFRAAEDRVEAALGANANGVPVELAVSALLRGDSGKLLEKSVAFAVDKLKKEADKLKERYKREVPLPPPVSLRTIEQPAMMEPLSTLMEVLSPEYPVFLSGQPFTKSVARAAVAIDRGPDALDEVAEAMALFQRHGAEAELNATRMARLRRVELRQRHLLEMEELYSVDAAAAVLESSRVHTAEGPGVNDTMRAKEWAKRNKVRRKIYAGTLKGLQLMQLKELEFYEQAVHAVLDHLSAKMAIQSDMLTTCLQSVTWVINSRKPSRNDTVECLLQANEKLAEAYDLNEHEAGFYSTTASMCGAMAVAVEQTARMLMTSVLELEPIAKGSKTGLSELAVIALRNMKETHKKAHKQLQMLVKESPVMKKCHELLKPKTTTTTQVTTTAPAINDQDRSPSWLRRKAFIQRVEKIKAWQKKKAEEKAEAAKAAAAAKLKAKNSKAVASNLHGRMHAAIHHHRHVSTGRRRSPRRRRRRRRWFGRRRRRRRRRRRPVPERARWHRHQHFQVTGKNGKKSTFGARTAEPEPTTADTTDPPTDPIAREQVLALANRLKAFSQGIAEYDLARISFAKGDQNEGEQELANTYDDLEYFSDKAPKDELQKEDGQTDVPETAEVRKLLGARIANVEGNLQVPSYLRDEGTDGVNFFQSAVHVAQDTEKHVDSVAASMDNVLASFKTPADIAEGGEAVGMLMGGTLGKSLHLVRKEVMHITKNLTKTQKRNLHAVRTWLVAKGQQLVALRKEFHEDMEISEGKNRWHGVNASAIDGIHYGKINHKENGPR